MTFLKKAFLIFISFSIPYYVSGGVTRSNSTISCDFFEPGDCENCTEPSRIKQCDPAPVNYCFASWIIDIDGQIVLDKKVQYRLQESALSLKEYVSLIKLVSQGCIPSYDRDCQSTCVRRRKKTSKVMYYCCCDTDQCNIGFSNETSSPTSKPQVNESTSASDSTPLEVHVLVILTCSILIITLIYSLYSFRKRKLCYFNRNSQFDQRSQTDSSSIEKLLPIELVVKKAEGRFGEVWKATYKPKNELLVVAVKIVPAQFKSSWSTELEVFRALQSGHENILQFYGAEKHYDGSHPKYWLITSYHERGSLCEHLKNNTLTYEQACSISYTMVRGLDYLHDEIFDKLHECSKPAVAHRDFKSNNVLLKDDFTACIADFGLAIIFKNSQFDDSNHGQVGTRRYMAPEVLQGSITFSIAAFQRIDMYACGLVLWEILSRCTAHENATAKYKLPFEDELGEHPTIEQMLDVVVQQKKRPEIKESWENNPLLTNICKTIEDCWEAEPEARVSASLVVERFSRLLNPSTKCETEASLLPDI